MAGGKRQSDIVDVAESLFGARGYHATSMREMARELDLQAGSLYTHIGGKAELLAAIVERAAAAFDAAIAPIRASGDPAPKRLRAAIRAHLTVIARSRSAAAVYFDEWRHLNEPFASEIRKRRDDYEAAWRELIAEGVQAGELQAVDPALAARLCLSACNWSYQWLDPAGPLSPEAVADAFADMLLAGLSTSNSRNREPDHPVPSPTRGDRR